MNAIATNTAVNIGQANKRIPLLITILDQGLIGMLKNMYV